MIPMSKMFAFVLVLYNALPTLSNPDEYLKIIPGHQLSSRRKIPCREERQRDLMEFEAPVGKIYYQV